MAARPVAIMAARTWLRLCAVAIIATGLAAYGPVYAQAQTVPAAKVLAPLPPDVAFGRFIALIRGHLLTGEELVVRRQWDAARPHFNFPTEEVYGVIRGELRSYKTPPFDGALKSLARTVKSHSARQYPGALRKVESALAAADTGLKARQPDWARFQVKVAVEVLKTAPDEFDDAVAGGRIVRPIGYQSARGFILQADRMFESVADEFAGGHADALADIRAGFARLKAAFASVNAPRQPVLDGQTVLGIVTAIESAAGKLG
jgi:hypothetical protein